MRNINVTCGEIQTDRGFEYRLHDSLNQTLSEDCEQSWYSEVWHLIADPSNPHKWIDPVISVSSDRLITSDCVNLNYQMICDKSGLGMEIMFRVRNETADVLNEVTPDLQHSDQFWWLFALFIIFFFIILMCYMLRKRIFRCFSKAPSTCNDSENRHPESSVPVKVRSDSPDSLNHSESDETQI